MNKKLRILLCSVLSVFTIFAFAFTGCDETGADSSGSTSDSTTDTSDSTAHTHTYDYSNITWNWSSDYSSVTASVPCTDGDDTLTVEAKDITITENVITEATKLAKGSSTYTASFTVVDGTPYSYTTDEVETPATATVYDPAYLEDMTAGSAIAKDTSIFGGFATVVGEKFYYTTLGENDTLVYEDEIVSDYEFSSRLYIFNSTEDQLSFTLTSDATVTFYLGINSNNSQTLIIKNSEGEAVHTTETSYATTTTTSGQNYVFAEEVELEAGTYTLAASYANYYALCLYGIVVEGDDYTDGIWNYSEPAPVETTTTLVLDSTVYVETGTTISYTATEEGFYTFTVSDTNGNSQLYADAESFTALLDESNGVTSYTVQVEFEEGETSQVISFYVYSGGTFAITTAYSETEPEADVETSIPQTLATDGTANEITLSAYDAYEGATYSFKASVAGDYTFSIDSGADAYIYIGGSYYTVTPYRTSLTRTLEADQTITITFFTWSANEDSSTAETYNFYITVAEDTGAVIPEELSIPGDTEAVLNNVDTANSYYYLTDTVTTAGTYTFTLTGDVENLDFFAVYYGTENDSVYLNAENNYTYTQTYAIGDTIGAYAYLLSTVEENTSIKLNISVVYELALDTTTNLAIEETETELVYDTTVTYTVAEGTTDLNYCLTLSGTTSYWSYYLTSVTVTVNGTEVSDTNNYHYNLTLTAGTSNTIVITYTASSSSFSNYTDKCTATLTHETYVPVTTSVNSVTDSENYALTTGENTIALSTTDASSGITVTFTADELAVYTFEIVSGEGAKVTILSTTLQVTSYSSTLTTSMYLAADKTLSITFKTSSGDEGTYTFKITKSTTLPYETLTLDETSETAASRYINGESTSSSDLVTYMFLTYTVPTDATSTAYYISLSGSSSYWNYSLSESDVTISINGATAVASTGYSFELTLTAGTTYNFIIAVNGNISSSYYVYASLYSGTIPVSSINADTENEGSLIVGTNTISLTASDADNGYTTTMTLEAGTYTFTVVAQSHADVYVYYTSSGVYGNYIDVYDNYLSDSFTLTESLTVTIKLGTFDSDGGAITYTLTITKSEDSGDSGSGDVSSVPTPLVVGDNTIYVTASDSSGDGVSSTYTATTAGTYTFSIDSTADAYVKINNSYVLQKSGTTSQEIELSANQTVTVLFFTYSYNAATYTFTITAPATSGDDDESGDTDYTTSVPEAGTLAAGTYTITLSATDAYAYKTVEYSLAAGSYTITLTTISGDKPYLSVYSSDYYTVSSGWFESTTSFEITETTTIYFIYTTWDGGAGSYTLVLSDGSTSGDDEGTTTTIASVDFTTFTSNTLSTTADAAFEDLKLEDGTDTGFDVIGKISSGSETVASIKSQNSVMSLNFGGACTYTAATEEGSEATVSSAIRYYLTAGTYTVTVSYFSIATDTSNDKDGSGRYAIVRGSDGTILSDTVTDAEKTDGVQTIITREMEITVSADGYIYIGSASSGLYISAITITQTTTTAE